MWGRRPLVFARRNTLWIVVVLVAISLNSCRHDVPVRARRPTAEGPVTLVLLAEQVSSSACCRVATANTGHASLRVMCHLAVFDAAGRLGTRGWFPARNPGIGGASDSSHRPGTKSKA
jgi:hypothetical protein